MNSSIEHGPVFYERISKNKFKIHKIPLYSDNLGCDYKGYTPHYHKKKIFTAKQPDGSFLRTPIQIRQCQYVSSKRKQCQNKTYFLPYCKKHTRELLNLEVKTSTLKNAGLGLFAYNPSKKIVFKKSEFIHFYHGEVLTWSQYEQRYFAHLDPTGKKWFTPYAADAGENIIDSLIVRGVCGFANDNLKEPNAVYKYMRGNLGGFFAKRDIFHGEEIFISYGKEYWDSFPKS